MLEKLINFAVDTIQQIQFDDYDEKEFAIAKVGFLSTRPNSHGLEISEKVLRECASTVLGKWMVAKMNWLGTDATTHEPDEQIMGVFPKDQEIEFVEDDDGYLRAYATAVISKMYAKKYCDMFVDDNERAVSVEIKVQTENGEDMNDTVLSFGIIGVTTLGKNTAPSCPESDVTMIRFSQEDADAYFNKMNKHNLTPLKKFAKERTENMAEKNNYVNHPIDTSKDALYEGEWDGQKAKQDLVKEKNFKSLAPKVCMKLESGWEDREVNKLGYPVMMLHEGKWVYSTKGLSSALGYAKKENETAVINKVEKIYEKLGLGKEEEAKMAEIAFAAVNIGELWNNVWNVVHKHSDWRYSVEGIYEQDNKKFAILKDGEGNLYRLDFILTEEEGLVASDTIVEVKQEFIETEDIQKFAEPENVEKYKKFEDCGCEDDNDDDDNGHETEMSADEMKAEMAKMKSEIEDRDNIIMEKDKKKGEMEKELSELREFKKTCMEKEKACTVESVMNEVKDFMDGEQFKALRDEGMACEFAQIDAWTNKVKAACFSEVKKNIKKDDKGVFAFAMPWPAPKSKSNSIWDRLENK